jgi:hypothetical protein
MILVAIGAVLVPLHHRLEHWVTEKLPKGSNKHAEKLPVQQPQNGPAVKLKTNPEVTIPSGHDPAIDKKKE